MWHIWIGMVVERSSKYNSFKKYNMNNFNIRKCNESNVIQH